MQELCCSPSIRQVQVNSCCGSAQVPNKFLLSLPQWSGIIFTSQSPIFPPDLSTYINYQNTRPIRTIKFIWLQDFIHHHTKKQVVLLCRYQLSGIKTKTEMLEPRQWHINIQMIKFWIFLSIWTSSKTETGIWKKQQQLHVSLELRRSVL